MAERLAEGLGQLGNEGGGLGDSAAQDAEGASADEGVAGRGYVRAGGGLAKIVAAGQSVVKLPLTQLEEQGLLRRRGGLGAELAELEAEETALLTRRTAGSTAQEGPKGVLAQLEQECIALADRESEQLGGGALGIAMAKQSQRLLDR